MLRLFGKQENLKNICRIALSHSPNVNFDSPQAVKLAYLKVIQRHTSPLPVNFCKDPFINSVETEDQLIEAFSSSNLNDLSQDSIIGEAYAPAQKSQLIQRAREALSALKEADSALAEIFYLSMHSIFIRQSRRSKLNSYAFGSTSSAGVGLIWLSMMGDLNVSNLKEVLLHEFIHNLIFIDEMNHPQFNYQEIPQQNNYCQSAILHLLRPLDKVVHSIIVATEIILARESCLGEPDGYRAHPISKKLKQQILQSLDSISELKGKDAILYPRTLEILDRVSQTMKLFDF